VAGGQERILRRRIKSVQATKKITRAMELIAASRISKAQQKVAQAVPYSDRITEVVQNLAAAGGEATSPLLQARPQLRTVLYVVLTADRGLCGGYNANVERAAEGEIKNDALAGQDYELVTVGRKGQGYFRFRGYTVERSFGGFSDNPSYLDARHIATHVIGRFVRGEVDAVRLVYTRFVTPGFQEVVVRPLAPLEREILGAGASPEAAQAVASYEYEPSPTAILDSLLPRYAEARVYAALLNAAASEHAARQRAMKAATDNAEELIRTLSRVMNRARQDAITTEIMEIVGGAEALRGGHDHTTKTPDTLIATGDAA
jgi:F-type H+-transporting ATPase subunit gamma